nr:MAG TPA: activator clamp loader [Caudoviricetes sp.]
MNLASKYRPQTFEEVVAQEYVKEILLNQLQNGAIKHGYLFCGGAGTGKTTTARIFAKDVNKGLGSPIEIDAASNNGVENVRNIIEDSRYKSMDSEFKVYIIDEVHMLSTGAFNALLKTLEEPSSGTVFILCTTDPQKIPDTILSRVQRFDFTRIDNDDIVNQLQFIIESENEEGADYSYERDALSFIGKLANGGMRDSITRLEKVLDYSHHVDMKAVSNALGVPDYETFASLVEAIANYDGSKCLEIVNDFHYSGKDLKLVTRNFTDFLLEVCKYWLVRDISITQLPAHFESKLEQFCEAFQYPTLLWMLEEMNELAGVVKWEPNAKPIIETKLLLMSKEE